MPKDGDYLYALMDICIEKYCKSRDFSRFAGEICFIFAVKNMEITLSRNELQLTRGRLYPLFLRYALPGVLAMLFLALQSIADGFIVGRFINATALAAVNIVVPAYTLVTAIALIIGVGTQAQIGIHMGRGDYEEAKTALRSGMTGLAVFAVTATVAINIFAGGIVLLLGANQELMESSVGYLHGLMPWMVGLGFQVFFDYTLKALGHPRFAMAVMIGTILLNILSSTIFVLCFDMGTFGAGLGTGISFTLGAAVSGIVVWRQLRNTVRLSEARSRFSMRAFGRIFYNGSSEGLAEIAMGITTFLFNITLMKYVGKEGVAAFTLINYLVFIGVSVMLGISNGVIPIISYNYGALLVRRVTGIVRLALKSNFMCGVALLLLLWICGRPLIGLFIDPSESQVIDLAVRGARFVSVAFLFNGFNIFAASFFTAIDKAALSLLVASLRGLILLIIGIFTLPHLWGVDGIWLTIPIADFLTTLAILPLAVKWKRRLETD